MRTYVREKVLENQIVFLSGQPLRIFGTSRSRLQWIIGCICSPLPQFQHKFLSCTRCTAGFSATAASMGLSNSGITLSFGWGCMVWASLALLDVMLRMCLQLLRPIWDTRDLPCGLRINVTASDCLPSSLMRLNGSLWSEMFSVLCAIHVSFNMFPWMNKQISGSNCFGGLYGCRTLQRIRSLPSKRMG